MAVFNVTMYREFEAYIRIEAESAEEAGEMVRNGDFSHAIEGSYDERMDEVYTFGGYVMPDDDEYGDDPLYSWNDRE